ncbi:amino acid adenylation domain-containing protein [Streptomyces sp. NPDC019443]|uniref:amino acid adenylation domain-containing protein n=1 Tax=Streptomyces sp. NPDC019443 TaxID=3365061 RepID=UPI0037A49BEB
MLDGSNGWTTLLDVLSDAAEQAPEQVIVHVRDDGSERVITFGELRNESMRVAGGYRDAGLEPGTHVLLLADRSDDFQPMFWGSIAAGLIPVPLAPEAQQVLSVWELLDRPPVTVDETTAPLLASLPDAVRPLRLTALRDGRAPARLPVPAPQDVAFLQFSSGSTGAPKGIELTHASVLANLEQIRVAAALTPRDVVVSWMPYFHDMGLIGTHLAPLAARLKQVKVAPLSFAKRPALWFEAAARHRATLLSAANFALALVSRRVADEALARLDLSSVRLVLVGAEPIAAAVWREFLRKTSPASLDARALQPVYGLAEATLAVTFPPLGEVAAPLVLDRAALSRGRAVDAVPGPAAVELMDVGRPVAGCAVRIVDDGKGNVLGDRHVGHIEVSGPQVARGYHRSPEATAATFADAWLRTGDMGFVRDGRLCVTGRHKDVVFINGRTFHALDLEEVASSTPGLPPGRVTVVGSTDPVSGQERVVVFVQWARPSHAKVTGVLNQVAARVGEALAHDDVRVLPVPPGAFPLTTSGKVRRSLMRARVEAGRYADVEARRAAARETPAAPLEQAASEVVPPRAATRHGPVPPLPRRDIERALLGIWARVLGRPEGEIDPHDRFLAVGGSSLKAMEVLAAVEDAFGITVRPAALHACDTVAALTEHVLAVSGEPSSPAPPPAPSRPVPGTASDHGTAPIAIVGMACRFPGADTPDAFWTQLTAGHDAVTDVPPTRWTTPPGAVARWGSFLTDPAGFDAGFFGVDEEEARATDPQARLFLELAHEALERAGYAGTRRRGRRVGVFAAVGESGYREVLGRGADGDVGLPGAALVGNLPNLVAARVAHHLDLSGPALAVDTACSSALVALHLARRSLLADECDVAVIGGVNLNLTSTGYRLLEAAQALSPTGRCHTFSAAADGFVPGEGGAAIVLTRLDDAQRADDPVLALLRGTAVNNDGRSLSLMAPNPLRQREVIAQAYRDAGVDPDTVSYVEAHGTGTAIGDPVEVKSLAHAFAPRADGQPRLIGSVKTNLGHLLNAAGMPSLVKVVLALTHRQLPASLHHTPLSPELGLADVGFEVVTEHRDWASGLLVAGINAFGFGGTNAHAILEQAPSRPIRRPATASNTPHLLTLSARSAPALRAAVSDLAAHLRAHPELGEGDVCAGVRAARDDGPHRLAVVADGDLAARLAAGPAGSVTRSRPRPVFLLPGQGAQRPGQGRALHAVAPVFRQVLEEASALTGPVDGRSLAAWCLDPDVSPADLARTQVAQPLLVAFGVALARQLQAWGVRPDAVAGHSVGEIAAGCVAGALTLADAVRFASVRGRLMGELTAPGAMAAVRGGEKTVARLVASSGGTLCVAAVNSPAQVVIAGAPDMVDQAVAELRADGIPARRLEVSRAFHSPMMRPALDALAATADGLAFRPTVTPLMSTVTAQWQPGLDPEYLREHAIRPVRFGAAVEHLLDDGYDTFVELGPRTTLPGLVRAAARAREARTDVFTTSVAAEAGSADSGRALLETVGRLWTRGADLSHTALDAGRTRVAVPTYPFQRRTYWPKPETAQLLHRFAWDDAPLTTGYAPRAVWLAGPDSELSRALADRLTDRGVAVYRSGDALPAGAPFPDTAVLLAGPSAAPDSVAALDATQHAAVTGLQDLLALVGRARPRLFVVTEDVHATGVAPELLRPAQALLTGLTLALPEELPGLAARSVDLSSLETVTARLDAVDRELYGQDMAAGAGTVAWRAGRRLTRTPVAVLSGPPTPQRLPADGVYLITGGAGGVGAALARDLAGRGRPTLVLCGRSAEPPADLLAELDALGAVTEYRVADVSVEADVDALLAGLPRLDAVFHAAGVARPGTLRSKSQEEVGQVLAAKVRGSHLLARALRRHGHRPTVCVAFSSVASVLPGLAGALGDYAAANAFLDAFAAAERAAGQPWQALNFAALAGTGLAAGLGTHTAVRARGGKPLAPGAALSALHSACGIDAAQLLVADLTAVPEPALSTPVPQPADTAQAAAGSAPMRTSSAQVAAPTAIPSGLAQTLRRLLAAPLHRAPEEIADDEPFLGMGLDSLTAVDLVKKLERELDRQLPTTLFFEHQTVRELAAHLQSTAADGPQTAMEATTATDGAPLPLTPVQLAFHTNGRLHHQVTAYGFVRQTISGPLDPGLLGQALAVLAEQHPMLRIRIEPDGAAPRQTVAPPTPVTAWYEVRDLHGTVEDLEETLCNRPFDLAAEPPVRAVLAREGTDLAHLVLVIHHAAGDGFSLNILGEELWSLYTSLSQGRTPTPTPPEMDFADYAAALEAERASADFAEDQRYWRDALAAKSEPFALPYDGDPQGQPAPPLAAHQAVTDPELTAALRECAAAHGVSLFHLLLAAYARCLARWSGRGDTAPGTRVNVPINVARARREARLPGIGRLVGPLADTLPVFATVVMDEPAHVLAERLRQEWLAGERHARLTSLDLARLLPAGGAGPRTVSPASFSFARFPATRDPGCPVTVHPTAAGTASAATRLSLLCWESDQTLHFSWNFPTRLFSRTTVARLAREHLAELSEIDALARRTQQQAQIAVSESAPASAVTSVPDSGAVSVSDSAAAPPYGSGIVDRLRAQFRAVPDAIAVDTGETTLTYAALDRASAQLATRLRASGVIAGDLVALLTEPGADTVVGVVGILTAGAGWVPLDATHPTARLADQLTRCGARTVVCHAATGAVADALDGVTQVSVDDPSPAPATGSTAPAEPDDIAYVIFTSGSTGRPKAVPITHRAMENYLDWALDTFGYRRDDRLAQTASVCFDASVRQLLAPLLVGATVVAMPRTLVRDPEALLERVEQGRITVWSSVPTLWEQLLAAAENRVRHGAPPPDLSALRWIHVGGEALSAAHVRRWYDLFGTGHRIANLYGPTETTINATCHVIEARPRDDVRQVPIGRPITGIEVEVVAPGGHRCAPGEAGELLIAGVGLSPGYLGEPELTAAAFVERDGRLWYRSGDRVRRGPEGVLEFLGRLDDQVKIRGHRVELGEIEAVLHTHPGVARAAVIHRDDRLAAFVESRPGGPALDAAAVRAHLSGILPGYMLPARIHLVDALPLTDTGKIARARLKAPASGPDAARAVWGGRPPAPPEARRTPPATPTERLLARIWSELLDVPAISREDDFFALGGDSLLVLEVFAQLSREVPVLPRPTVIYAHGTLAALAAAVDTASVDAATAHTDGADRSADGCTGTVGPAEPGDRPTAPNEAGPHPAITASAATGTGPSPFPLTLTQRGFLLSDALAPDAPSAWLACLRLRGPLQPDRFQRAVDALLIRHPMLRTIFPAGIRPPVQQELPPAVRLPVDFENLPAPELLAERVAEERQRRLEPWAWPLLRLRLLSLAPEEHVLVVHAHHLIGDGYSAALLGRELLTVYDRLGRSEPAALPPLRATFRDYVALLERHVSGRDPVADAWRARLNAPYRQPVLRARSRESGVSPFRSTGFTLSPRQVDALRRLASSARTTLYAPVLTAYYRALADLIGQADLVLGLAVTGRDHPLPDANRVFGPFAAAVPLRPAAPDDRGTADPTFVDDLRSVAAEVADARTYGADGTRPGGGLPAYAQFFFSFLDFSALGPLTSDTLTLSWDDSDTELAPPPMGTDVFLTARPTGDSLRVTVRASAAALTESAFASFTDALRDQLTEAAATVPHRTARGSVDAALVGYLPAPAHLATLAGLPSSALPREQLRALLFPDAGPRLLEETTTPLGRSGFVCLPLFADELAQGIALSRQTARAVEYAASLGARCVSLAGMIPAHTGYGFSVLRESGTATAVTTGHAATAVSVVKTVHAALKATRRDLGGLTVAMVGLGSIGSSSLELLLTRAARPPARLLLCDVAGSGPRLKELAENLCTRGLAAAAETVESDPALPNAVYEADLVITAVSGGKTVLDIERLRPGTIVVDDSFPHCFDTASAITRMRRQRDVLVVGGGLLALRDVERRIADGLPSAAVAGHTARSWIPGTIASCRLESLLQAAMPGLPLVHGLVDTPLALAYGDAMETAGVRAAPLHLLDHTADLLLTDFPPIPGAELS